METIDIGCVLPIDHSVEPGRARGNTVEGRATADGDKLSTAWMIKNWNVSIGSFVEEGTRLATLVRTEVEQDDDPREIFVVAPRQGTLSKILKKNGSYVGCGGSGQGRARKKGQVKGLRSLQGPGEGRSQEQEQGETIILGRLTHCSHPELHGTLCTSCGRNILSPRGKENGRRGDAQGLLNGHSTDLTSPMRKVTMKGGGTLTITSREARVLHVDKSNRLMSSRKLALVLDLDNTLLHCTDHPEAPRLIAPGTEGMHVLRLPDQPRDYHIKLRPGLRWFLKRAAANFEMTIYTAGTSQYAEAVAKVLDPERKLFQGRHISTCYTPDLGRNTKSLERIFPCGLDMALIVDDRDDVWQGEQSANLLLVRPYKFFTGQRSVPSGPSHSPSEDVSPAVGFSVLSTPPTHSPGHRLPLQKGSAAVVHSGLGEEVVASGAGGVGVRREEEHQSLEINNPPPSEMVVAVGGGGGGSRERGGVGSVGEALSTFKLGVGVSSGADSVGNCDGMVVATGGPVNHEEDDVVKEVTDVLEGMVLSLALNQRGCSAATSSILGRPQSSSQSPTEEPGVQMIGVTAKKVEGPDVETTAIESAIGETVGEVEKEAHAVERKNTGGRRMTEGQQGRGAQDVKKSFGSVNAVAVPPMTAPLVGVGRERDPQLECTLRTLERVHKAFYSEETGQPRAVARFLGDIRRSVLRGVRLVLSGLIPVSVAGSPSGRDHRICVMACALGAVVEESFTQYTTHVVAARAGTVKVNKGLNTPGVFVVHADWLMNCVWHCRREKETSFLLTGQMRRGPPPPPPPSPPPPPHPHPSQRAGGQDTKLNQRFRKQVTEEIGTSQTSRKRPRDENDTGIEILENDDDDDDDDVDMISGNATARRGRGIGIWGEAEGGSKSNSVTRPRSQSNDSSGSLGSDLDDFAAELEDIL